MKKAMISLVAVGAIAGSLATSPVMAANSDVDMKPDAFDVSNLYFGVGPTRNTLTDGLKSFYDDATGWEVFAGYDLGMGFDKFKLMVEVGHFDSGDFKGDTIYIGAIPVGSYPDFKVTSNWLGAVVDYSPVSNLDLMVRVGVEKSDSSNSNSLSTAGTSRFIGAGVGYWFVKNMGVRATVTQRDGIDSIGISFLYGL